MKLYENPPLILRLMVIAGGLLLCLLAGASGSILWLAIGLAVGIFACAWGNKDAIQLLRNMVIAAKNGLLLAIGFLKK